MHKNFVVFSFTFFLAVYGCWAHVYFYENYWPQRIQKPAPVKIEPAQPEPQRHQKPIHESEPEIKLQHVHNHDPTGKPPEVVVFLLKKICKS
jgi:hypothetical protein